MQEIEDPVRKKISPEVYLIILVWVVLISSPFLFDRNGLKNDWLDYLKPLETLVPIAIVFFINRFILVPVFLIRVKKVNYLRYLLAAVFLIITITAISFFLHNPHRDQRYLPPPHPRGLLSPESGSTSFSPEAQTAAKPSPMPPYINVLIFSILLTGFDTGLRLSVRLAQSERSKEAMEKAHIRTQLLMLQNQISPHFFLNTLNNIHALIDINMQEAKQAIIQLSGMMRYLLYDTKSDRVPLALELDFIRDYFNLMQIRFTEDVSITVQMPDPVPDKFIPPLLFTSFLENAFKHGVSYQSKSYIALNIKIIDDRLYMNLRNSTIHSATDPPQTGIGLGNSRQRLSLLFGENYVLENTRTESEYIVNLIIPI